LLLNILRRKFPQNIENKEDKNRGVGTNQVTDVTPVRDSVIEPAAAAMVQVSQDLSRRHL